MKIEINTNEFVVCELTDYGMETIKRLQFKPEIIEGNIIKIQLWELMHQLGEWTFNGAKQCIVGNKITLESKWV